LLDLTKPDDRVEISSAGSVKKKSKTGEVPAMVLLYFTFGHCP
jgi:hypothetical protein